MYKSEQNHGKIGYADQILRTKKKTLHIFPPSTQLLILVFNTWTFYFILYFNQLLVNNPANKVQYFTSVYVSQQFTCKCEI